MSGPATPPEVPPIVEIERRIRWPAPATLAYLVLLAVLTLVAVLPLVVRKPVLEGLPDDPDVRAAAELSSGLEPVPGSSLRFASALFGTDGPGPPQALFPLGAPGTHAEHDAIAGARARLERAAGRRDPRVAVFLAHLDFAEASRAALAGDARSAERGIRRAEKRYRAAADRAELPEARLGLGALLSWRADREPDTERKRGLRLQAVAQLLAVGEASRVSIATLYDRALLLARVERLPEARRWADAYLARDPESDWAERLREEVAARR